MKKKNETEYCDISKNDLKKLLAKKNNWYHYFTDTGVEIVIRQGDVDDMIEIKDVR